tara:strand:- start:558 stop:1019 length:462 start_codon:yes stop_codon:yes gene_type:complete
MQERTWVRKWLRDNKAQLVFEASAHTDKTVSAYLVPAAGLVLRYRAERDGRLDMDELFIPAGGQTNTICRAVDDLDNFVGVGSTPEEALRLVQVRADRAGRTLCWLAGQMEREDLDPTRAIRRATSNSIHKDLDKAWQLTLNVADAAHDLLHK